jgi:hypothetical protein
MQHLIQTLSLHVFNFGLLLDDMHACRFTGADILICLLFVIQGYYSVSVFRGVSYSVR